MKTETKNALMTSWSYCDEEDKSTEFMLKYMQDTAGVDLDCVLNFLERTSLEDRIDFQKSIKEKKYEQC